MRRFLESPAGSAPRLAEVRRSFAVLQSAGLRPTGFHAVGLAFAALFLAGQIFSVPAVAGPRDASPVLAGAAAYEAGIAPGAALDLPEPKPAPAPGADPGIELPHPPRRYATLANWPPADPAPAIDVLDYALDLEFELNGFEVAGTATILLRWENDPDAILRLDMVGLTALAVRGAGGIALPFVQTVDALEVDLAVQGMPASGDTLSIEIDYRGANSSSYYAGVPGSHTFTEPNGSRAWFPCHDVPWDKATLTLTGTCVAGRTVVSNGYLVSRVDGPGVSTFTWRMEQPVPTYLIAVAVSQYAEVVAASPITPLTWYVFPGNEANATLAFSRVPDMLAFYDATLAPWPYPKYAQVEGDFGGGMEHTTCSLMGSIIINAGTTYEWVTAHELAHQYFGDWVTLESWQHIWLNEGFATFYDLAWHEAYYGPAVFKTRIDADEQSVLNYESVSSANRHAIVDPPVNRLFSTLEYKKASWILRMLRDLVGKPAFDAAVADYLSLYGGGVASTDDFRAVVEAHHGSDLAWYFEQWLYGIGSPRIAYHPIVSQVQGGWLLQIDLRQIQTTPTVYRLPVEVRVTTAGGDVTMGEWLDGAHQVFAFPLAEEPIAVTMDPANKLLGTFELATTTSAAPPPPVGKPLRAWPNPFHGRLQVASPTTAGQPLTLDVLDARGRLVATLGPLAPGAGVVVWDGGDAGGRAAPGTYFVRARETGEAVRVVLLPR